MEKSLYDAVRKDNLKKVKSLLSQGADANFEYRFEGGSDLEKDGQVWYETALISAVTQMRPTLKNRLEIVKALVEAGADVNKVDPIHSDSRIRYGNPTSNPLETPRSWGYTALMGASNNGFSDVVDFLISKGANVNVVEQGACPETALWLASYTGRTEAVKALIKAEADLNFHAGCRNQTALGIAKDYQREEVVKILMSAGAHE